MVLAETNESNLSLSPPFKEKSLPPLTDNGARDSPEWLNMLLSMWVLLAAFRGHVGRTWGSGDVRRSLSFLEKTKATQRPPIAVSSVFLSSATICTWVSFAFGRYRPPEG
jgi:hypothetical protein